LPSNTAVKVDELPTLAGKRLGDSDWQEISQERINQFADATGDHQWIHVDPARAAQGPFKTTIAHGYLTLSMASGLLFDILQVDGAAAVVNYGAGKVRFPAPVPVGSRVRLVAQCTDVSEVTGGYQITLGLTFEREGSEKPVCVAEILFRYYLGSPS
jgi:acyl dehydratase